ncbi:MAG: hypothetical protein C4574_02090 [Candidatus Latescibacterota bacterium]|jgi:hypothetical protein|nr:MAG: hypothetical protein C4574_02090 [Candidatus Latescibacterota bacterium]
MSLRLALLSLWTPKRALAEMLGRVEETTVAALDGLLAKHSPGRLAEIRAAEHLPGPGLDGRRAAMAAAHNARVSALIEALGRERAVSEGREALFKAGVALGKEARERLGLGKGFRDFERAARILYRSLGIDFTLAKLDGGGMLMRVHRCALSEHYAPGACAVLSAADEGVVRGLDPTLAMRFEQRMTDGPAECVARIEKAGE